MAEVGITGMSDDLTHDKDRQDWQHKKRDELREKVAAVEQTQNLIKIVRRGWPTNAVSPQTA